MAEPLPSRATLSGTLRVLVAALVLFAQMVAPGAAQAAMIAASGEAAVLEGGLVICHVGSAADEVVPASVPSKPAGHAHDCLLCPACHIASLAALPVLDGTPVPAAPPILTELAAPPPPATGPPHFARIATPPTGPPHSSI